MGGAGRDSPSVGFDQYDRRGDRGAGNVRSFLSSTRLNGNRPHILGHPSYSLIQRAALLNEVGPVIPVGSASVSASVTIGKNLQATQAFRIVEAYGAVRDQTGAPGNILVRSLTLELSLDTTVRSWLCNFGNLVIGDRGLIVSVTDDEFLQGADYSEFGSAAANPITLSANADVLISAAATAVDVEVVMLYELYNMQTKAA